MLSSKERAQLRAMANTRETIVQIGKGGVTESVIAQVDDALRVRELVKGRVLENSLLSPREVCTALCEALQAEPVQVIGTRFVLYRENPEEKKIELGRGRK